MNISKQLADYFREVQLSGRWIAGTNLKEVLSDVTWEQATTKVYDLNTIAALVFHINYYVSALVKVLDGGPLDAHDKLSFDMDPITSKDDWEALLAKAYKEAELFAQGVEKLNNDDIFGDFVQKKYGSYYRNIQGMIEHSYYHFGQIVMLKKLVKAMEKEQ